MFASRYSSSFTAPVGRESGPAPARSPRPSPVNRVWQSLATRPAGGQPALAVSTPADPAEQDAERIADDVMAMAPPAGTATPPRTSHPVAPAQAIGPRDDRIMDGDAGASVRAVMRQPGQPLDAATRRFFEPRFGHKFDDVRLHTDAHAADASRGIDAHAFTVGSHVALSPLAPSAQSPQSRRLLAHELAHVVQQRAAPASGAIVARQSWGTAKTTAPPAQNVSPGDIFRGKLTDEVALFANAGVVLDWIFAQRPVSVTTALLFADTATMKKLKPPPAGEDDLLPAMAMLEFHGVLKRGAPGQWTVVLAPLQPGQAQQDVDRAKFDQNRKDISAFRGRFEARFDAKGHPVAQIAQRSLLEDSLAAGSGDELKGQTNAAKGLAAVNAELDEFVAFRKKGPPIFRVTTDQLVAGAGKDSANIMLPIAGRKAALAVPQDNFDHLEPIRTGASPEVEARRQAIGKRIQAAEKTLFAAQDFHRFAVEVVFFLHQLDATSPVKFKAGTYPRHGKFGEYAADLFPIINENSDGFYEIGKAGQFVDAINAVAEAGHPEWGKFAWQIVYNDAKLQAKVNAKYGGRMTSAPHHGPAPDKLHMHLDIRPLNVAPDRDTGFGVSESGRVFLF